jgi:glycosyltransferase involved in cell wall biosynthesis
MRVLEVFEPGCDGVFRHVEQLCRFLAREGVEIDIAYSSRRPSAGLYEFVSWIRSTGGMAYDLGVGPAPTRKDAGAALAVWQMVRARRPDVVHAHSSKAGALVRSLPPMWWRPAVFYTPHAYYGMSPGRGLSARLYDAIERVLGRVGTTINVSHDEARFAMRSLGVASKRRRIIPNPVECRRFSPPTARERAVARESFQIPAGRVVVGFASRWSRQKDPDTAYRLFERALAHDDRLHLLHLCKRTTRADAGAFAAESDLMNRITFVDYSEDVRPFFHASDVFLMTSRYEAGWPFVLIEALACGLPAVVTECIGMSDVGMSGLSACAAFPVGDVAAGADGLRMACSAWLGTYNNHRELVLERFSPEHCFGRVLAEYRAESGVAVVRRAPGLAGSLARRAG